MLICIRAWPFIQGNTVYIQMSRHSAIANQNLIILKRDALNSFSICQLLLIIYLLSFNSISVIHNVFIHLFLLVDTVLFD